jgi:tRNA A-37 threonylcarbamoyl transferase component Bud32
LFLIDFHSARLSKRRLALRRRFRDLTSLSGSFLVHGRRSDRLRFFKAYCSGLQEIGDWKSAARDLEAACWRRLCLFLRRFDRRPLREGRPFQRLRVSGWTGIGERSRRASELARFLCAGLEAVLAQKASTIKAGAASSVHSLAFTGGRYVVKVFRRRGAVAVLKDLLRGPKARTAWVNSHRLLARKLRTARPVLFVAEPRRVAQGRSLLVCEEESGLPTLDRFVADALRSAEQGETRFRAMLHRLARSLARMHTFFLANRDLKAQNILVDPEGNPVFLDLQGLSPTPSVGEQTMARDLMRLNASFRAGGPVSLTDRLRFLKIYARARGLDRQAEKRLCLEILRRTQAKWKRWE